MSDKADKFREASERVKEKIESKPTPPSSDTGRDENERGHTNFEIPKSQNER